MPARHRSKPGRMLNHSFASSTDSTAPLHSANPPASAGDRCTPPLPQAVQHHAPTMESKHIKFSEWFLWCLILLWNPLRLPKPGLIIITYPAKNLWNAGLLFSCCGFAKRANQIRTNWHSRTHNKRTNMTTSQIKNHPSTVLLSHVFSHQAAVDQEWLARLQCCSHVGHQGMEPSIAEWQILKYPGCTDLLFYCLTCFHYWQDRNFCNLRFGALTAHWKANKKLRTEVLVPVPQQPVGIASIALKRPISCFLQLLEIPQQTWNIRKTGCPGSLGHPIFHYHILTHILTWKIGCPGSLGHPIFQEFVLKYSDSLGMLADICSNPVHPTHTMSSTWDWICKQVSVEPGNSQQRQRTPARPCRKQEPPWQKCHPLLCPPGGSAEHCASPWSIEAIHHPAWAKTGTEGHKRWLAG